MTLSIWQLVSFLLLAIGLGFVFGWFLKDYFLERLEYEDEDDNQQLPVKVDDDSKVVDNLQEIRGISAKAESTLNDLGITSFAQVAQLEYGNMAKGLESFGGNAKRYKWIEQAKTLHEEKYGEQKQITKSEQTTKSEATAKMVDDLQEIKGISARVEDSLNELGIINFAQVAQLEYENMTNGLEGFKGNAKRYEWIEQAKVLHEEKYGEKKQPTKSKAKGTKTSTKSKKTKASTKVVDNLQEIRGISAKAEDALNELGITSFAQVAQLGKGSELEELKVFKGNAARFKWVEQAKALHKEKYGKDLR